MWILARQLATGHQLGCLPTESHTFIHKSNIPGLASKQIDMSHQVNLHPFLSQVSGIHQVWSSECILTSLDSDQLKKYLPLLATKYQVSTTKNIWIATHHPFCSTSNPKRRQKKYITCRNSTNSSHQSYCHTVDLENLGFTHLTWNQGAHKGKATTSLAWLLQTTPTPHLTICHKSGRSLAKNGRVLRM